MFPTPALLRDAVK